MPYIFTLGDKTPTIADNVFVAPNATIVGQVTVGSGASIWYGAVLRGDSSGIIVGQNTSIQDNCVVHVNVRDGDTIIGDNVTIGHGVVLESCRIGAGTMVGMNATILSGADIGEGCLIAAGAVVREGQQIPPNSLVVGVPAKVKGELSAAMRERLAQAAPAYSEKYAPMHAKYVLANRQR